MADKRMLRGAGDVPVLGQQQVGISLAVLFTSAVDGKVLYMTGTQLLDAIRQIVHEELRAGAKPID